MFGNKAKINIKVKTKSSGGGGIIKLPGIFKLVLTLYNINYSKKKYKRGIYIGDIECNLICVFLMMTNA